MKTYEKPKIEKEKTKNTDVVLACRCSGATTHVGIC